MSNIKNPFLSFWMGGYECADHLNAWGNRVDFLATTGHLSLLDIDYKNLSIFNIKTVREGIRWSQVETAPYQYDWSTVRYMIAVAKANNVQQIWDLCHFGYPTDLWPQHPQFTNRFVALCTAFVKFYRSVDATSTLILTPINEVSFLAWLGGQAKGTVPYGTHEGWEVKYYLIKAYIKGIDALKAADPTIRILTTEPLINIVPHTNAAIEDIEMANVLNQAQFEVTEMLCGRLCPELGGGEQYLDILGYNYYYNNQYTAPPHTELDWKATPPNIQFTPLQHLLTTAYKKYKRPFVLTETSHPKEDRPLWLKMITAECKALLKAGLPLWGICWYPMLNRLDWDNLLDWHYSGIWDDEYTLMQTYRSLHVPTAEAFLQAQQNIIQ